MPSAKISSLAVQSADHRIRLPQSSLQQKVLFVLRFLVVVVVVVSQIAAGDKGRL